MFRYAATIFVSAFLLFQVQPLLGRYILPWFGGGPSIWTTCMLFFQLLLLGGYLYAHLISVTLSARTQAVLHLILLSVSLAFLPIAPSPTWKPVAEQAPALQILLLLLATVGGPYLVLASTGPLMQQWFSRSEPGRSPYRLYSLSNVGSLLALLSYPFVFEPWLTLKTQVLTWSATYLLFAGLASWCALRFYRDSQSFTSDNPLASNLESSQEDVLGSEQRPTLIRMLLWLLLAAFGSAILLATTNQLCLDVATVPFLWVVPLSLYLLTFIICFDNPLWYDRRLFGGLLIAAAPTAHYLLYENVDISVGNQILLYSAVLFACCMSCHGELVRSRPHPRYLTLFYLLVSAGGALGGIGVAIFAPAEFTGYWEYHLALFGCCLLTLLAWIVDRAWRQENGLNFWVWANVAGLQVATVYWLVYRELVDQLDPLDATILFGVYGLLFVLGLIFTAAQERSPKHLFWVWVIIGSLATIGFSGFARMRFSHLIVWPYRYELAMAASTIASLAVGGVLTWCQHRVGGFVMRVLGPAIFVTAGIIAVWILDHNKMINRSTTQVAAGLCIAATLLDWGLARWKRTATISWGCWFWGPLLILLVLFGVELRDLIGKQQDDILYRSRNFYGVLRVEIEEEDIGVYEHGSKHQLMHGQIQHGFQYLDEAWKRTPTSYYGPESGLGLAIRGTRDLSAGSDQHPLRVGVVGLGTGTIAAYGKSGEFFRFYEINPDVRALSGKFFSYLSDSGATTEVVIGDARVVMERQLAAGESPRFDVLAIDAFSSDAIPVHLLTTQCSDIYRDLLRPSGVLAVHISNRFLDLEPITRGIADHLGWQAIRVTSDDDAMQGVFDATWVLITNSQEFAELERIQAAASAWDADDRVLTWTDDYSGLWRVLSF